MDAGEERRSEAQVTVSLTDDRNYVQRPTDEPASSEQPFAPVRH
jgi:hypothetical protein